MCRCLLSAVLHPSGVKVCNFVIFSNTHALNHYILCCCDCSLGISVMLSCNVFKYYVRYGCRGNTAHKWQLKDVGEAA